MPQINSNFIKLTFNFRLISKDNFKCHNRQGRYFLSNEFKDWEKKVRIEVHRQIPDSCILPIYIQDSVYINITVYFKNKRHADTTNLFKGLNDALIGIVYLDDRQIKKAEINVVEKSEKDYFTVEIGKIEEKLGK